MKTRIAICLMIGMMTSFCSFSQMTITDRPYLLKVTSGRISFGTGDFFGYSVGFEVSKNMIKKPRTAISKLMIGAEVISEHGTKNPVVNDPTPEQFFNKTFYQVSGTTLWIKAGYYPFKRIVKGFNIHIGPTICYFNRSTESRASRVGDPIGGYTRFSTLSFNNGLTTGYRISTGYEFEIGKRLVTGIRADFSNNTDADANTLIGLSCGFKF